MFDGSPGELPDGSQTDAQLAGALNRPRRDLIERLCLNEAL